MKIDGIDLFEGSNLKNLTVNNGTLVERGNLIPTVGEMFYQTDNTAGLYLHNGTIWTLIQSLTANEMLTLIKTVDGTTSGLDADLLDGLDSTDYVKVTDNIYGGTF